MFEGGGVRPNLHAPLASPTAQMPEHPAEDVDQQAVLLGRDIPEPLGGPVRSSDDRFEIPDEGEGESEGEGNKGGGTTTAATATTGTTNNNTAAAAATAGDLFSAPRVFALARRAGITMIDAPAVAVELCALTTLSHA